jgi:single-stranded DNA-binding protein
MSIYGTIKGRVGFDAEVRATRGGRRFLTFKVASNRKVPHTDDQWLTTWVKCEWWGDGVDLDAWAQGIVKGRRITCEGFIELEEWQGKEGLRQGLKMTLRAEPIVEEAAPYEPRHNGTQARGASDAHRGAHYDREQPRGESLEGEGSRGTDDIPF